MVNDTYSLLHTEILNPLASEVNDNGDPDSFFGSLYAYGETHYDRCLQKYVPLLIEAYKQGGARELERRWQDLQKYELQYCHCDVTDSNGTPYYFAEQDVLAGQLQEEVNALIHRALRRYRSWLMSGEEGANPLKLLSGALTMGIEELNQISAHTHRWNEDDYCDICGADGRA